MKKFNFFSVFLVILLWPQLIWSQQRVMGIDEMFELADRNNKSMKAYRFGVDAAEAGYESARAERLPSLNSSLSVSYLGNGYLWDRNFSNGMQIDIPHFGNDFSFSALQVIYAGGAINRAIELSDLSQQMAELDFQNNRQQIRFMLCGYYFDLFKICNLIKVYGQNIALTEKLIASARDKNAEGVMLQNDVTRYELQLENLKLQCKRLQNTKKILNVKLLSALGLDDNIEIIPDSTLLLSDAQLSLGNDWQRKAMESSLVLKQAELGVRVNEQKLDLEHASLKPNVALVVEDHLNGPVTIEVPALNNNFNYWYAGIGVRYDFSALYKCKNKIRQAEIIISKSREEQSFLVDEIETAVLSAFIQCDEAISDLQTCEKSLKLADQNYVVVTDRYQNDLALLTEMLDAANTKLSSELEMENARLNVIYNYYKLKYLCGLL